MYDGELKQGIRVTEEAKKSIIALNAKERKQRLEKTISMHDRVFEAIFAGNKNNPLLTDITNLIRSIHKLEPIPAIKKSVVQKVTTHDSFLIGNAISNKSMTADLIGYTTGFNITVEVQREKQEGFAARSILSSANIFREGLEVGGGYTNTSSTIGINFLNFKMPELDYTEKFLTKIVRADYETGEHFLPNKFADYYLELPKLPLTKGSLSKGQQELWELCTLLKSDMKKSKEAIMTQTIESPVAKKFADEFFKVMSDETVQEDVLTFDEEQKILELIKSKGREEGREEVAKKLISRKVDIEEIKDLTSLPEETILNIAKFSDDPADRDWAKKQVQFDLQQRDERAGFGAQWIPVVLQEDFINEVFQEYIKDFSIFKYDRTIKGNVVSEEGFKLSQAIERCLQKEPARNKEEQKLMDKLDKGFAKWVTDKPRRINDLKQGWFNKYSGDLWTKKVQRWLGNIPEFNNDIPTKDKQR